MTYRLYIDEVGTDDLGNVDQDANRFLSLTGIAISKSRARDLLAPTMAAIKADIFQHDPDVPLIFHRTDIVQKKGLFGVLRDEQLRGTFDNRIIEMMQAVPYFVITAVIDKRAMMQQHHWNQKHPYHFLLEVLVEKYVQLLERVWSTGDIMPEKRNPPQNTALQRAYEEFWNTGTRFVGRDRLRARLPAKVLKFRAKAENIPGLQLTDLIAHPSYIYTRRENGHQVVVGPYAGRVLDVLIASKYDRSFWGRIPGYGIKYLP